MKLMKKIVSSIGFLIATCWAVAVSAACPTNSPQTTEAYVYGCPTISSGLPSSAVIPLVPSSTTAPTSSLEGVPSNLFLLLNDAQALTNKTINCANNTCTNIPTSALVGNLSISNFNSGTSASSSTFWRGDGTWATPSGGGTVTSITFNTPLTGGTITGAGTVGLGNVPVSNLNSGTSASSSTFWRGDGVWATPSGGGTGTAPQAAYFSSTNTVTGNPNVSYQSGLTSLNYNAASGGAFPAYSAPLNLRVSAADGASAHIQALGFGNNAFIGMTNVGGTGASPSATPSLANLGAYTFSGWDAVSNIATSGLFRAFSTELFASGHHGTRAEIAMTPTGSSTLGAAMIGFENDGGITIPRTVTGGDQGPGTINMAGCFVNGVPCAAGGGGTGTAPQAAYFSSTNAVTGNTNVSYQSGFTSLNYNAASGGAFPAYSSPLNLRVSSPDGSPSHIQALTFGNDSFIGMTNVGGTGASPTATGSGANLGSYTFSGWDGVNNIT